MRIALVCIAKNEDNYIHEWVNYHLKLGFDSIFIYENDWESNINNDKVFKIKSTGVKQQIPSYNHFIQMYRDEYDWCAFLDVDEFLVLKKHRTIHQFINDYKDETAIGINWVFFGDNNLSDISEYSVIKRFTMCEDKPNEHIKTIVNVKKCNRMWVHNHAGNCVDTNYKQINNTPYNPSGPIDVAQINHYFSKTKSEYIQKMNRGRADTGTFRDLSDFDRHNFNVIEDLTAYNFYFN
jgi:hypothetical protein